MLGLYRGYMGIMEKKMETTIMSYVGYRIWGIRGSYFNIPKGHILSTLGGLYQ